MSALRKYKRLTLAYSPSHPTLLLVGVLLSTSSSFLRNMLQWTYLPNSVVKETYHMFPSEIIYLFFAALFITNRSYSSAKEFLSPMGSIFHAFPKEASARNNFIFDDFFIGFIRGLLPLWANP